MPLIDALNPGHACLALVILFSLGLVAVLWDGILDLFTSRK